jgi:hypothetical protein
MTFRAPDKFRVALPGYPPGDDKNGFFIIELKHGQSVRVIASDGAGWEHVSVSRKDRTPTWDEMCQVKDMFWGPEDCVVQFHPPKSQYVNVHPNCLHLWRRVDSDFATPPMILVG